MGITKFKEILVAPSNKQKYMKFILKYWSYFFIILVWVIFSSQYLLNRTVPVPSDYLVSFFPPWNAYYGMPVKNNAMPDIVTQIYPWKHLSIDSWKNREIPLWNPYSFSGTVNGANYQSAIFAPINILFFILPFLTAWSLSVLLQPLIAGLFMNLFLRSIQRSHYASTTGSIAFMFCGFITTWMGYQTLGWSIVYLPLALYSIVRMSLNSRKWWGGLLLSLSVAGSFYSGHYQISLYLVLALIFFVFGFLKTWREKVSVILHIILGLLLASPQLFITFKALLNSDRSGNFTSGSIPWQYLSTLLAPDYFGNPVTRNDWFGQYAEWASYIGVIPFILAIYGIISKKFHDTKIYLGLFIISTLIAFATPINSIVYLLKIPIISTSVATRIIVLVSFSLIILSAYGLDYLITDIRKRKTNTLKIVTIIFVFILFCIWGGLLFNILPEQYISIAKRNSILPSIILFIFLVSAWTTYRFKKITSIVVIMLLVVTSFDLLRYSTKWLPKESSDFVYPELSIISELKKTTGDSRVFGTFGNELNTIFHIQSIEGYDALYQKRYGEFISAAADGQVKTLNRSVVLIDKQGIYTKQWLDLLGVKYILYRKSDGRNVWVYPHWKYPGYETIYNDNLYEIIENKNALPRAFLASDYEVAKSDKQLLSFLTSKEATSTAKIILEKEPSIKPNVGAGTAKITKYSANSVEIEVDTDSPKLLYLSDVYDSGWLATVNDKPTTVYRANYAFRAIEVGRGLSKVKFYYQPKEIVVGFIVSFLTFSVLIGLSMRKLLYGRRNI